MSIGLVLGLVVSVCILSSTSALSPSSSSSSSLDPFESFERFQEVEISNVTRIEGEETDEAARSARAARLAALRGQIDLLRIELDQLAVQRSRALSAQTAPSLEDDFGRAVRAAERSLVVMKATLRGTQMHVYYLPDRDQMDKVQQDKKRLRQRRNRLYKMEAWRMFGNITNLEEFEESGNFSKRLPLDPFEATMKLFPLNFGNRPNPTKGKKTKSFRSSCTGVEPVIKGIPTGEDRGDREIEKFDVEADET